MTLAQLKRIVDELYETNNFSYSDFQVAVDISPESEELETMDIHLLEQIIYLSDC